MGTSYHPLWLKPKITMWRQSVLMCLSCMFTCRPEAWSESRLILSKVTSICSLPKNSRVSRVFKSMYLIISQTDNIVVLWKLMYLKTTKYKRSNNRIFGSVQLKINPIFSSYLTICRVPSTVEPLPVAL